MKLSISVPDELWLMAQAITGLTSPSAIVQQLIEDARDNSPIAKELRAAYDEYLTKITMVADRMKKDAGVQR